MTFDEAIEKVVEQGAIRVYRLSNSLAFVYRLTDSGYQARGLYAVENNWALGKRMVSVKDLASLDGWFDLAVLPWQAEAIELEAAKMNPGYGIAIWQQCHTCKKSKPQLAFLRTTSSVFQRRNWECNECYERRTREIKNYRRINSTREGDYLSKATIASPPPAEGEI